MRLTMTQSKTICELAQQYFGSNAQVWLFGSRVNDDAKGGDIDLYIESPLLVPTEVVMAKLEFLRGLHVKLGEQKIDVVIRPANNAVELPIYQIAKQTGVQLS